MVIGLILILIMGFVGYQQYQKEKQENYNMVYKVYQWVKTEEYGDSNPLDMGITIEELEKKPPKIEMNGHQGLYISTIAYNHATGNQIDYEDLKEMMEEGKVKEVYEKYEDYINWFNTKDTSGRYNDGYGTTYRDDYASAIIGVGGKHGIYLSMDTGSYPDYKNVIDSYPEEVETVFQNLNKNAK